MHYIFCKRWEAYFVGHAWHEPQRWNLALRSWSIIHSYIITHYESTCKLRLGARIKNDIVTMWYLTFLISDSLLHRHGQDFPNGSSQKPHGKTSWLCNKHNTTGEPRFIRELFFRLAINQSINQSEHPILDWLDFLKPSDWLEPDW
jgi:hypothetical protein